MQRPAANGPSEAEAANQQQQGGVTQGRGGITVAKVQAAVEGGGGWQYLQ